MTLAGFRRSSSVLALCRRDGTIVESSRAAVFPPGTRVPDAVAPAHRLAVEAGFATRDARVDAAIGDGWYQLEITGDDADDRVAVVATEIAERRELAQLLSDLQTVAHLGVWEWEVGAEHTTFSPELYRIYGLPETYRPTFASYLEMVHPDDRRAFKYATKLLLAEHTSFAHDVRVYRPDGSLCYLSTWTRAILDEQGRLVRLVGVCQDVTDRKVVEQERERALAMLQHAQKLEAVGRLTGGIAHDFNNILGIVVGYASLIYRRLPQDSIERRPVSEIIKACERGRRMTSQLLAFSKNAVIERGPLALDLTVSELLPLIERLVGDRVTVESTIEPDLVVEANASQIEQVLINLAANARDAMPDGGTFTIAARAERAGEQARVVLSVSDTGVGMPDEVREKIFDPFFTTKPVGQGTGLGLSTVYGIVTQSGGTIAVHSEPGKGTRFELAFPRVDEPEPRIRASAMNLTQRGHETILLVEDEPELRDVVSHTLAMLGYQVLAAPDAIAALRIAGDHAGDIHVVLTDVVMPKLSGRELVEQLVAKRPTLRVLFMSGYTTDVMIREGIIDGTTELIRKPFHSEELAQRLRTILER